MGLFRKATSMMTLGAVDFRSDKERTARYARQTRNAVRRQGPAPVSYMPMPVPDPRAAQLNWAYGELLRAVNDHERGLIDNATLYSARNTIHSRL